MEGKNIPFISCLYVGCLTIMKNIYSYEIYKNHFATKSNETRTQKSLKLVLGVESEIDLFIK